MANVRVVDRPFGLNCSLSYLPWSQLIEGLDSFTQQSIKPNCLAQGGSALNSLRLLQGMTLRISDALLFPSNAFAPGLSQYSWRVPDSRLSRDDLFFLSMLLAAADPDGSGSGRADLVIQFRQLLSKLATAAPDTAYREISSRVLAGMPVEVFVSRAGAFSQLPGTAARVREWLLEPSMADFEGADYPSGHTIREFLRVRVPVLDKTGAETFVSIRAFESSGGFFLDQTGAIPGLGLHNTWYAQSQIFPRRFHFAVQVDISLSRELGLRQVPVYYSLADVERDFHVGIFGFQRQGRFFNCVRDSGFIDLDPAQFFADGVATVYFGDAPDPAPVPAVVAVRSPIQSVAELKEQLLVAPGDRYFVNPMVP